MNLIERGHQWLRSRRFQTLIAGLALVLLVVALSAVKPTMAGWKSSDQAKGSFAAGSLTISNLKCTDNSVLLGLGGDQLKLDWDRPQVSNALQLEYTVTVVRTPLVGAPKTATFSTQNTTYTYRDTKLSLVSLPTYKLTVQAKPVGTWTGAPLTVNGSGINLLGIGVVLRCRA